MQAFEKLERMVFPRTGVEHVLQIFLRNAGDPVEINIICLAKIAHSKLDINRHNETKQQGNAICFKQPSKHKVKNIK